MSVTDTLAYYGTDFFTTVTGFIVQHPGNIIDDKQTEPYLI
jgi:hypothetical protein